jgi:hypothetical protein
MSKGSSDWKRVTNQHLRASWLVDIWKCYIRIWNRYLFTDFGCDFSSRTHRNGSANNRSQFLHQSPSGFTQWRRMPRYFLGRISGWIFVQFFSEIFCCYLFVMLRDQIPVDFLLVLFQRPFVVKNLVQIWTVYIRHYDWIVMCWTRI